MIGYENTPWKYWKRFMLKGISIQSLHLFNGHEFYRLVVKVSSLCIPGK